MDKSSIVCHEVCVPIFPLDSSIAEIYSDAERVVSDISKALAGVDATTPYRISLDFNRRECGFGFVISLVGLLKKQCSEEIVSRLVLKNIPRKSYIFFVQACFSACRMDYHEYAVLPTPQHIRGIP